MNSNRHTFGIFNKSLGLWNDHVGYGYIKHPKVFYYNTNMITKRYFETMKYEGGKYFIDILKAFEITLSIPRT